MKFVAEAVKLRFHVHVETDANGGPKINAECLGNTELLLAITRCLASRPQANDLKHLLVSLGLQNRIQVTCELRTIGHDCSVQDCQRDIMRQMFKDA